MSAGDRTAKRYLVEQRLKDVMVAAVDDGDVDRKTAQRKRRMNAAKSRADDHNARPLRRSVYPERLRKFAHRTSL